MSYLSASIIWMESMRGSYIKHVARQSWENVPSSWEVVGCGESAGFPFAEAARRSSLLYRDATSAFNATISAQMTFKYRVYMLILYNNFNWSVSNNYAIIDISSN